MTDPKADRPEETRDPLTEMSMERVRRSDGRSLIYYSWPPVQAGDDTHLPESSTAEQPDV